MTLGPEKILELNDFEILELLKIKSNNFNPQSNYTVTPKSNDFITRSQMTP